MEWMILPFKRYFDFSGRSRRMEFWMFQLLNVTVGLVLMGVIFAGLPWAEMFDESRSVAGGPNPLDDLDTSNLVIMGIGGTIFLIWWLATIIPSIALIIRRLHDLDKSGWWYGGLMIAGFIPLVNLLALVGWVVFAVFMFLPGTAGENRFGLDPKDPGQARTFE